MGKNNWTKKELKEFKDYILNKRKTVIDEMEDAKQRADEMLKNDTTNAIYSSHMADAGSDQQSLEHAYSIINRESKFLNYLDKALQRIDDKTFGICFECGELISKARLAEVPHATKCFDCKTTRR